MKKRIRNMLSCFAMILISCRADPVGSGPNGERIREFSNRVYKCDRYQESKRSLVFEECATSTNRPLYDCRYIALEVACTKTKHVKSNMVDEYDEQ